MAGGLVASVRAAQTQTACHNLPCFVAGGVFPGGHGRGGGASTCAFGCAAGAGARADGLRIGPSVAGGLVVSVGAAQTRAACHNLPCFVAGGVFPGGHGCGGGASTCAFGCAAGAEARADGLRTGPSATGGLVASVGAAQTRASCRSLPRFVGGGAFCWSGGLLRRRKHMRQNCGIGGWYRGVVGWGTG